MTVAAVDSSVKKSGYVQNRLDEIKSVTDVSDDQLEKIRLILEGENKKRKELSSLQKDEKKVKMKNVRQESKAAVDAILTDEQRDKLEKARQKKQKLKDEKPTKKKDKQKNKDKITESVSALK